MSDKFRQRFENRHVVLPVIHVEFPTLTFGNTLVNIAIAYETGCDGIFLINHSPSSVPCEKLLEICQSIRENTYSKFWIGINSLELYPAEVFERINQQVDGIWTDNARINEFATEQFEAEEIQKARVTSEWDGLYFGGVAFKYQQPVRDLKKVSELAMKYVDVVTTTGVATGKPADIEKIRFMKKILGQLPLAIASGITPDNIYDYLDIADCFLVATGISKSFTQLDYKLTKSLVDKIRNYDK